MGDALSRAVQYAVQSGMMSDLDGKVDMVPVDYVSRAIVKLSLAAQNRHPIYHLANPRPARCSELTEQINK